MMAAIRDWPWPTMVLAALPGLVMGALSLTGWYGAPVEFTLWTVIGIGWALVSIRSAWPTPVAVLTVVGLMAGILTGLVQGVFAETLVTNNPGYATVAPDEVDAGLQAQFFGFAVLIGLVWGALFGLVTWAVTRVRARRAARRSIGA